MAKKKRTSSKARKTDEGTHVTTAELSVLEALWREADRSIRQITDELYPSGTTSDYATVQKLLERLEAKSCVTRNRDGFAHTFSAIVARGDLLDQELASVADKLCEGSLTPLLVHLVGRKPLPREERDALRRLLEEQESGEGGES
ncbi:MAG: BlaI/MecI/CopY family transcriptional regulator [Planctomycetota bacterium]